MALRTWSDNTGNWSDPIQWGGVLPAAGDTANFGAGPYTVTFATTATLLAMVEGSSTGTFDLTSGELDLTGNSGGSNSGWSGVIVQSGGTLVQQSATFNLSGNLTQTGGDISVGLGAHLRQPGGSANFGGSLSGMGELDVGGTVTLSGIIHIGAISMGTTGVILIGSNEDYAGAFIPNSGSLLLDGNQITFSGHDNFGATRIVGPGTVAVDGSADLPSASLVGTGATLFDAGTMTADGPFALGSSQTDRDSLVIDPGAAFAILTDFGISSNNGSVDSGSILNDGLLEKAAGLNAPGIFSNISAPLTNNGTLRVAVGTMLLTGGGSMLGGEIDGNGTLSIGAAGGVTLLAGVVMAPTLTMTVGFGATLALDGSGNSFSPAADLFDTGLNSVVALQDNTLTAQGIGAFDSTVRGPGLLRIGGRYDLNSAVVTGGTTTLEVLGLATQSGHVRLGTGTADTVTLHIDAGGVYDVVGQGAQSIDSLGTATIVNDGLFAVTASGGAPDQVLTTFTNTATGTLLVAKGAVNFAAGLVNNGDGTIAGVVSIAGGLTGAGSLTLEPGSLLTVTGPVSAGETITFAPGATGAELVIATPTAFAGTVDRFAPGETLEFPGVVFNTVINATFSYGLEQIFNGATTSVGSLQVSNPPGTFFLTEDGAGGRKILGSSPGSIFPGPFLTPTAPVNTWTPADGLPRSWFTAADWSTFGIPDEHQAVTVGEPVAFNLEFDGGGLTGGTVNNLTGAATTVLDLISGDLQVNEGGVLGGTFSGIVNQTGGKFDSVTGYTFNGASYGQGANGFLESDSGVLTFAGENVTLGGTVYGAGILAITGGAGTLTPVPGVAMQVNEILVTAGGSLVPFANETFSDSVVLAGGNMPLFASAVTLGGTSALAGTVAVTTNGTIIVTGTANDSGLVVNGTSGELLVQGTVTQTSGDVNLNSTSDLLSIAAGGTYDIEADVSPFGGNVVNAGLFEKSGGAGQTHIEEPFSSTGEVDVDSGTLWLDSTSVQLGGTVSGAGTLLTSGGDVATLDAGLFINVATFAAANITLGGDESYGGVFTDTGNLMLQGHTLTLSDTAELMGSITGPGVVNATHSADLGGSGGLTIQGNGVTFNADGVGPVTQSNNLALGGTSTDHVTLAIPAGHTYDLLADNQIGGIFSGTITGTIANAGVLEKIGGAAGSFGSRLFAELVNTGTVVVQHGTLALETAAINDGVIVVDGALVVNSSAGISADSGQTGTIVLAPTATLIANAPIAASETIVYDPGGLISIGQLASFGGAITNFTPGDTIDLLGIIATGFTYAANGTLTLTQNGTTQVGALALPGLANPAGITLANDANSGTFIIETPCFAEGTRIATMRGPVAVEDLREGELVVCASGKLLPVQWIGHRHVDCHHHPRPREVQPVRIAAGAFGGGLPRRPLRLSPDHAVYVDHLLVPVRYLINGVTITQEDVAEIVYWHIELHRHEVLLAEGLPAESYLDTGNGHAFGDAIPHTPGIAVAG